MSSTVGWDGDLSYSSEGEVRDGSDKCIPDGSKYTREKPEIYRMICLLSEGLFMFVWIAISQGWFGG